MRRRVRLWLRRYDRWVGGEPAFNLLRRSCTAIGAHRRCQGASPPGNLARADEVLDQAVRCGVARAALLARPSVSPRPEAPGSGARRRTESTAFSAAGCHPRFPDPIATRRWSKAL